MALQSLFSSKLIHTEITKEIRTAALFVPKIFYKKNRKNYFTLTTGNKKDFFSPLVFPKPKKWANKVVFYQLNVRVTQVRKI